METPLLVLGLCSLEMQVCSEIGFIDLVLNVPEWLHPDLYTRCFPRCSACETGPGDETADTADQVALILPD
jgi:hypothetical protein